MLGGGRGAPQRAGESIAKGLGSEFGLTYSLKEYEDIVYRTVNKNRETVGTSNYNTSLSSGGSNHRLSVWRMFAEDRRSASALFDTRAWTSRFTRLMQATWEASHICDSRQRAGGQKRNAGKLFHIYSVRQDRDTRDDIVEGEGERAMKGDIPSLSTAQVEVFNSAMAETHIAAAQATLKHIAVTKSTHIHRNRITVENDDSLYHEKIREVLTKYQSRVHDRYRKSDRNKLDNTMTSYNHLELLKILKLKEEEGRHSESSPSSSPSHSSIGLREEESDHSEEINKENESEFTALPEGLFDGDAVLLNIGESVI